VEDFKKAYPGIEVEHQQFQSSSRDFVPRLLQEQKAGLYNWDVATMPLQEMMRQVKEANGLLPLRPLLVRGDVLDDKVWNGGFEKGFDDNDKKWGYTGVRVRFPVMWINTDQVKEGELRTIKDLIDPKWRGKIVAADPRTKGSGFVPATVMRVKTGGDDIMKQLFKDQEPLISTDARQLTEFMVRARGLIGVGAVDKVILADFLSQGLGGNLKNIDFPEADFVASNNNHLWHYANAPHPKAAQVFANWLLTKEGQISFSTNIRVNSRRNDVPVVEPEAAPTPGVEYIDADLESFIPEQARTQEIAKGLLD
jgi:iron(III) transport system substrate-binding protein